MSVYQNKSFLFLDSTPIFKDVHGKTWKAHSRERVWVDVCKHGSLLSFEILLVKVLTQEIPMDE